MLAVNTVTGPAEPRELGFTLMHEHVIVCDWSMRMNFPGWFNRDEQLTVPVRKLSELKSRGVNTIVDPTPIDLGRDVRFIQEASKWSGLRIICATGFYHSPSVCLRWHSSQDLSRMMVRRYRVRRGWERCPVRCNKASH
jgi:phosphotriesterase-related protein